MKKPSLEEAVRGLLAEQNDLKKAWEKETKPKIDIGGQKHDPSSPNKGHIEEEQIDELHGKGKLPAMKAHYEKKAAESKKAAENISTTPRFAKDKSAVRQVLSKFAASKDMESKAKRADKLMNKDIDEDLNRNVGHATPGLGARHSPKKSVYKNSLGALEARRWGGNQARKPSTYNAGTKLAEAREEVMKKISKKDEKARGKTDTGQTADSVDFKPNKPELTTNH
jgi:hypothetical protein